MKDIFETLHDAVISVPVTVTVKSVKKATRNKGWWTMVVLTSDGVKTLKFKGSLLDFLGPSNTVTIYS